MSDLLRRLLAIVVLFSASFVPAATSVHAAETATTRPPAGQFSATGGIMDEGTNTQQNNKFELDLCPWRVSHCLDT
jgi:hypothetical protein